MHVTARLAECLAARMLREARCSRTTSLQAASAKSLPARVLGRDNDRPVPSREVRALTLHTERLSPKTSPDIDFAPNVAPQVRPRRRNGLVCRDVLRRCARNSQEHEEGKKLCPVDLLDEVTQRSRDRDGLLGLVCLLLAPNPQHRSLRLVPRKLSHLRRPTPVNKLRSPCQRVSQGHGVPQWASLSVRHEHEYCDVCVDRSDDNVPRCLFSGFATTHHSTTVPQGD